MSPKFLVVAHQTAARKAVPNNINNKSISDNLDVRKNFFEIDGVRYPKDCVKRKYGENGYLDQYGDLKTFYKEYLGGGLMNPFTNYMVRKYY